MFACACGLQLKKLFCSQVDHDAQQTMRLEILKSSIQLVNVACSMFIGCRKSNTVKIRNGLTISSALQRRPFLVVLVKYNLYHVEYCVASCTIVPYHLLDSVKDKKNFTLLNPLTPALCPTRNCPIKQIFVALVTVKLAFALQPSHHYIFVFQTCLVPIGVRSKAFYSKIPDICAKMWQNDKNKTIHPCFSRISRVSFEKRQTNSHLATWRPKTSTNFPWQRFALRVCG